MTVRSTTHAAGRSVASFAAGQRARVFKHILSAGENGATLEEIETALGLPGNTVRPRRIELEAKGYVEDSGDKRITTSGRKAIVWRVPSAVVTKARAVLEDRVAA